MNGCRSWQTAVALLVPFFGSEVVGQQVVREPAIQAFLVHPNRSPSLVDKLVFGNKTADSIRGDLHNALNKEVLKLEIACKLTQRQSDKLRLAGLGDIHRYFAEVDGLRARFSIEDLPPHEFEALTNSAERLRRQTVSGPFGSDSIFLKVRDTTLTSEQVELVAKGKLEGNEFRRALLVQDVAQLVRRAMPMSDQQFVTLQEHVRKWTADLDLVGEADNLRYQIRIFEIPEVEIAAILETDDQRQVFDFLRKQAKLYRSILERRQWPLPPPPTAAPEIMLRPGGK